MYTYHPTHYPSFMDQPTTHDIYNNDEWIGSVASEHHAQTIINALNLAEYTTIITEPGTYITQSNRLVLITEIKDHIAYGTLVDTQSSSD